MRLDEQEIAAGLTRIPTWQRVGDSIQRKWRLPSFSDAIDFVQQVATLADRADHHPDILIQYRDVTLTLTTHDAGGLTERDFSLAETIDRLAGA
jgi:4a-hydroxytetrahydrobiopterin dehydratase